jgi:hypothetical protein
MTRTIQLERLLMDAPLKVLEAVLAGVRAQLGEGLSEAEVADFVARVHRLKADDDLLIEPIVEFRGESVPFVVDAFATESESLEVVFIAPASLVDVVEAEVLKHPRVTSKRLRASAAPPE